MEDYLVDILPRALITHEEENGTTELRGTQTETKAAKGQHQSVSLLHRKSISLLT